MIGAQRIMRARWHFHVHLSATDPLRLNFPCGSILFWGTAPGPRRFGPIRVPKRSEQRMRSPKGSSQVDVPGRNV
jgi:hypothetical protein